MAWRKDPNDPLYKVPGYSNAKCAGYNPVDGTYIIADDEGWRAEVNRLAMLVRSSAGMTVANTVIDPRFLRRHLRRIPNLSNSQIDRILLPHDPQNTALSISLILALKSIHTLPRNGLSPSDIQDLEHINYIASTLHYFSEPFINVNRPLIKQLESLLTYSNLVYKMYQVVGNKYLPSQVYLDTMNRVKNVQECMIQGRLDQESEVVY